VSLGAFERVDLLFVLHCVLGQEHWVDWPDAVYDKVGNILLSRVMGQMFAWTRPALTPAFAPAGRRHCTWAGSRRSTPTPERSNRGAEPRARTYAAQRDKRVRRFQRGPGWTAASISLVVRSVSNVPAPWTASATPAPSSKSIT
jgi:hypothetical protein